MLRRSQLPFCYESLQQLLGVLSSVLSVWLCGHLGQVLCKLLSSFLVSTNVSAASSAGVSTRGPSGCPADMEEFGPEGGVMMT